MHDSEDEEEGIDSVVFSRQKAGDGRNSSLFLPKIAFSTPSDQHSFFLQSFSIQHRLSFSPESFIFPLMAAPVATSFTLCHTYTGVVDFLIFFWLVSKSSFCMQ